MTGHSIQHLNHTENGSICSSLLETFFDTALRKLGPLQRSTTLLYHISAGQTNLSSSAMRIPCWKGCLLWSKTFFRFETYWPRDWPFPTLPRVAQFNDEVTEVNKPYIYSPGLWPKSQCALVSITSVFSFICKEKTSAFCQINFIHKATLSLSLYKGSWSLQFNWTTRVF